MPLLGAHMSISGGLDLAFSRILEIGGEALQIYTKNQRQWRCPALTEEAALRFRERREESGSMITLSRFGRLLGVCFDTCHAFAAGYDIRTPETYSATLESFDLAIGLDRIKFFHLNDSKLPLGSRVDRHEHIGKGKIGLECFRLLLNDPRFQSHPMVLETPKGKDLRSDRENLKVLRSLLNGTSQEICLRSRSIGRRKNLQST